MSDKEENKIYSGHLSNVDRAEIYSLLHRGTIKIGGATSVEGFSCLVYTDNPNITCASMCLRCFQFFGEPIQGRTTF